jgi:HEAT repeat protein
MGLVKQKTVRFEEREKQKPERDRDALQAALENSDAGGRRLAAREIVHCPDAATLLVSRLERERDVAVLEVILATLVHLNDPIALSGLVDCLRSEDAALRNQTIEAFKQMGREVDPTLQALLTDPDPDLRIFAVNILSSSQHPDLESRLIKVIDEDPHVNVCATAVDLLCEVGTEAAIDPLVRLKARFAVEVYIQFAADLALKRIHEI